MPFESDLVARQVEDFHWKLVETLVYRGHTDRFEVPPGESTDYASVPRIFQWVFPQSGRYTRAAVLHDYLWKSSEISHSDADGIFRRAMAELGVPFLRRWLMWAAVRLVSIVKSGFRDKPFDLVSILGLALLPGLVVIVGGAIVFLLLVAFWVVELLVAGILVLLRRSPTAREHLKPANWPTVYWTS